MYVRMEDFPGGYLPRLIIWQLTRLEDLSTDYSADLSLNECLRIIDSITHLSKPIVIFTGPKITSRSDLYEIVGYGHALNLKTIIELAPEELTPDMIQRFRSFGLRIFRIVMDDCIEEDIDTRFKQSPKFFKLESVIHSLRKIGMEIHLSDIITKPNLRQLSYYLDYALRCNAQGLYCHLRFDKNVPEVAMCDSLTQSLDEYIGNISEMKSLVPSDMYFSPQCIKYFPISLDDFIDFDFSSTEHPRWVHSCQAGKSFTFISETGKVYVCSTRCKECGDLRKNGYDFYKIWDEAEIFNLLRSYSRTCVQTRLLFKKHNIIFTDKDEINNEKLRVEL